MAKADIALLLYRNGLEISQFKRILDFGCGTGRIIRHWRGLPAGVVEGTDYNGSAIAWCQQNLPFRFTKNALDPPLRYEAEEFDFIYAFSVFTHLDAPRQLSWMSELHRVLRAGGYLLVTTHGTRFLRALDEQQRRDFAAGRLVVKDESRAGANACAVYHPEAWVRSSLAAAFTEVDYAPWGATGLSGQDMWLFRKETHAPG